MESGADLCFINGLKSQTLTVLDRGFQYGEGLFETILLLNGKPVLLDLHIQRLLNDSQQLNLALKKDLLQSQLEACLELITAKQASGILKIVVTRCASNRGYAYACDQRVNITLTFFEGVGWPLHLSEGVKTEILSHRLPDNPHFAGIKHLNRLDQVLCSSEMKKRQCEEGLVCGARGELLEGVNSNLFLVKDKILITPRLLKNGVKGVMRQHIMEVVAPTLNLSVSEAMVGVSDLMAAQELFVCNSVMGIRPVVSVGVRQYKKGPVTGSVKSEVDRLGYAGLYHE